MKTSDFPPSVINAADFRGRLDDYIHVSRFQPLASDKFTVTLTGAGGHRKLFMVQFRPRANQLDLAIHLPYFAHRFGRVGRYTLSAPPGESQRISLVGAGSSTTTQRVKLSHHADGTALFSQDGKIVSRIRTLSTPVRRLCGHFFTVHFWGLDDFESVSDQGLALPKRDRTTVYFGIDDDLDPVNVAGRIVGYCYPRRSLSIHSSGGPTGDARLPLLAVDASNRGHPAVVIAPHNPPQGNDVFVMLMYHSMPRGKPGDSSTLTLAGGFDPPPSNGSPAAEIGFLGATYTSKLEHWDEIVARIGTIDFSVATNPLGVRLSDAQ